jgi:hypothetical protein
MNTGLMIYGAIVGKVQDFPDVDTARKVQVDYTLAFADACVKTLVPASPTKNFRFVFCSGAGAVRNEKQARSLWFMRDTRTLKVSSAAVMLEQFPRSQCAGCCGEWAD